jgi:hypothetical protein
MGRRTRRGQKRLKMGVAKFDGEIGVICGVKTK